MDEVSAKRRHRKGEWMPSLSQQIIGLAQSVIASGRTRLVVTLSAITALTAGIYYVRECAIYCVAGIVIIALGFIIAKTIQDVKSVTPPAARGKKEPEG